MATSMNQNAMPESSGAFAVEYRGGVVHLHIGDELDVSTAVALEEHLSAIEGYGNEDIVIDLERMTFMDSSGVRCFRAAADRAKRSGRKFEMVNPAPMVRKVLAITGDTHLLQAPALPAHDFV